MIVASPHPLSITDLQSFPTPVDIFPPSGPSHPSPSKSSLASPSRRLGASEKAVSPYSPSRPPSRTEKRFICPVEGCGKAYFKPSRLAEHQLSHSGERPHACSTCGQTYQRASHLAAHMRTHKDPTDREFQCTTDGCHKRFWTATHLKRHEEAHDAAQVHPCTACGEIFAKTHLLREHFTLVHMPEGSKPYPCTHDSCDKSFSTKQQLRAHEKTHDPTRYTCSHPSHDEMPHFPTWSALQTHMHQAHPPTCPHPECGGRTFKSTQRLRDHLKVHEDQATDILSNPPTPRLSATQLPPVLAEALESHRRKRRRQSSSASLGPTPDQVMVKSEDGITPSPSLETPRTPSKLPRMADGIAGKAFSCHCGRAFKTRFARDEHARAEHDGKRHICGVCGRAYRRRASLRRHRCGLDEEEGSKSVDGGERESASEEGGVGKKRKGVKEVEGRLDLLTGVAYAPGGSEYRRWGCPYHLPLSSTPGVEDPESTIHTSTGDNEGDRNGEDDTIDVTRSAVEEDIANSACPERFYRVYDVRRHLASAHGVVLDDLGTREMLLEDGQTGE